MNPCENSFNAKGKTAERLVQGLALKTFLTDWCYLNPSLPNGKELCDLLVVYDEVAIIWQIKDLKLGKTGHYRKREVLKNLKQLCGARRQLLDLPTPIELDNPRRGKERFDAATIKEVFLISVLLGEGEEWFSFVENARERTIHVFTGDFTHVILSELDTVSDFVGYLRAKESVLQNRVSLIVVGGEEELLAVYLGNNRSFDNLRDATDVMVDQGSWEKLKTSQRYLEKKAEDQASYVWDEIIDRVHEGSSEYEAIARELARPNRFERRVLGKAFLDSCRLANADQMNNLFRRSLTAKEVTYCFLFSDTRVSPQVRRRMLEWQCFIARGKFKSNRKVVGIATEKNEEPERSFDFALVDIPEWTEHCQSEMERGQRETGILVNPQACVVREEEYPAG